MPLVWTRWMDNYYVRWIPFCKEKSGHPWSRELPFRPAVRKALSGKFITILMWKRNENVPLRLGVHPPTYIYIHRWYTNQRGQCVWLWDLFNEAVAFVETRDTETEWWVLLKHDDSWWWPPARKLAPKLCQERTGGSVWNDAGSLTLLTLGAVKWARTIYGRVLMILNTLKEKPSLHSSVFFKLIWLFLHALKVLSEARYNDSN